MGQSRRKRLFEILEKAASPNDRVSRSFDIFIMSLITLNVIAVVVETVRELHEAYLQFFIYFDLFSVAVFSIEYLLRLWACTENEDYRRPITGRLRYMITPMALVDLLAIIPSYFLFISLDSRFLRAVRLFRLFRLFKIGRYSESFKTLSNVLKAKKEELLINIFVVSILLVIASSLMYFIEHTAQPDLFSSIPAAMWWGVATLTTVGYGDVCPITPIGKILGALIALLGVGMFALPTGILASGFAEEMQRKRGRQKNCPHCGGQAPQPRPRRRTPIVSQADSKTSENAG